MRKGVNRVYSWIADFGLMLVRCAGYVPFHRWRRLVYRLAGAKIGKGSAIHMFATFFSLKNLAIGEDTVIGWWAFLDGRGPLTIGNHVDIASEVMIYNSQHDLDAEDFRDELKPVVIEDYVFIGPRAIIIPGVRIGKGAAVAAGAVVTKDVAPMTIVGGVPAKPIRKRNLKELRYRIGRARWFQ
jgi:maltose O-acetyltransferase